MSQLGRTAIDQQTMSERHSLKDEFSCSSGDSFYGLSLQFFRISELESKLIGNGADGFV